MDRIKYWIIDHRIIITALTASTIFAIFFGLGVVKLASSFQSNVTAADRKKSVPNIHYASSAAMILPTVDIASVSGDTLGLSDDSVPARTSLPTPTLFPMPTDIPVPTLIPTPAPVSITTTNTTSTSPSSSSCGPGAYYSEAFVSASSVTVNNSATISIELRDCNNNMAQVSDTLTVTQTTSDSGVKVNGSFPPVSVQTQNGKATLTVTSPNIGTVSFHIVDTTRSFAVTDPNNHDPKITFTSTSGSNNPNCSTGTGIANAWYSDAYLNSTSTTVDSSVVVSVILRDCAKNTAPVSDSITVSLTSGITGTQINGNNLPFTLTTQNGQVSFTVTSPNTGTATYAIQDTTGGFPITDVNNHNPSVTFSAASSNTSSPTSTPAPTSTPIPAATSTPVPAATSTPVPNPTNTPAVTETQPPGSGQ